MVGVGNWAIIHVMKAQTVNNMQENSPDGDCNKLLLSTKNYFSNESLALIKQKHGTHNVWPFPVVLRGLLAGAHQLA